MSKFAHIPWTVGLLLFVVAVAWLFGFLPFAAVSPFHPLVLTLGWMAGVLFCFTREECQREYQIIETRTPPLRRMLKPWEAFRFWQWNAHSKIETIIAIAVPIPVAVVMHLIAHDSGLV